jgi:hypothetical protein
MDKVQNPVNLSALRAYAYRLNSRGEDRFHNLEVTWCVCSIKYRDLCEERGLTPLLRGRTT